jgi:aryl-alcohol dehydrogenase-like predicted oxidoreductase
MEFRHLGRSGMLISEISYGNWVTASQLDEDAAIACVRAAMDLGITTFDTADVYAGTRAESILGRALTDCVDLYQAHRYDVETPLEETMEAFADLVHAGKMLYIGVSEWDADQIRAGHSLARELKIPFVSNQPQYSMLWRVIEAKVVPTCEELGLGQIVWSPMAQGVLTGKYLPGQPSPDGSR